MSEKETKIKKPKKQIDFEKQINDLTADLQRTRADFEDYRKRGDAERTTARNNGRASAILKLLPVIDNIERAIKFIPDEIKENSWVQGVAGLNKSLNDALSGLGLEQINAEPGTDFNPGLHDAIMVDEDATGEREVIAERLQAGYTLDGSPIRHAMVKVTRS